MRLRLQVERQDLPAAKVLWNVQATTTTAELLDQINDFFPLEAQGWGLEDYAVHVAGYEVLHFQQLGQVLKDDDEVTIKPLQTKDIRARTLSGRLQISADGRHLVDGVAYGRPLMRRPASRPAVRIPPRRRIRLDDASETTIDEIQELEDRLTEDKLAGASQLFEERDAEISEEDRATLMRAILGSNSEGSAKEPRGHKRKRKSVSFNEPAGDESQTSNSDDDDDGEFEPPSDDDKDTGSEADTEASDAYWDDFVADPLASTGMELVLADGEDATSDTNDFKGFPDESCEVNSGDSTEDSDSESNSESDSESDSDSDSESGLESEAPSEEPIHNHNAPGEGMGKTRARNRRRRDAKKLAFLKRTGTLSGGATLQDLKKWEEKNHEDDTSDQDTPENLDTAETVPSATNKKTVDVQDDTTAGAKAELEKKRANLLAAIASGGVDVTDDLSSSEALPSNKDTELSNAVDDSSATTPTKTETRRHKLDLASSQRLLWASLGVRAPKTEADKQKLKAKLESQTIRRPVVKKPSQKIPTALAAEEPKEVEEEAGNEPTDPDAWRSKINLIAVECVEEGVEYSTPPFPFKQRWDPQMRNKKRKRHSSANTSRKEAKTSDYEDVSYLDYDEEADASQFEKLDWAEPAPEIAAEAEDDFTPASQLLQEIVPHSHDQAEEHDLPPLPEDVTSLPPLTLAEAKVGAIITFSNFEASAATNWQPGLSPLRTARIDLVEESNNGSKTLDLELAKRDLPKKQYDGEGNRVYAKFEMVMGSDDGEEEEGYLTVDFAELVEPRMLVAAGEQKVVMEDGD